MLRLFMFVVLFVPWMGAVAAAPVAIASLHIEMPALDAEVLFRKDRYDLSSFPVSVLVDGQRLVGRIEVKGSFTRRFDKKSLLIKLDKGGRWQGKNRISLNAMATDDSLMREWLAWRLIGDLGLAGPQANYLRLYVNGRYRGLFLDLEWIDPEMLERQGLGADGSLFHPPDATFCGDLSAKSVEKPKDCWAKLAPRDENYSELIELVREIETTPVERFHELVDRLFDTASVVNWVVANTITSNGDTYNKNYFLYNSRKTGKWSVIPFDYDLTFGRNWDPHLPYPKSVHNGNFQYYYPSDLGAPSPFKEKILKNPVLAARIQERLRQVIEGTGPDSASGWFATPRMLERIEALRAGIGESVRTDPFLAGHDAAFAEAVDALKYYAIARAQYLRRVVVGNTDWNRDRVTLDLVQSGATGYFTDGWGYLLGTLTPRAPTGSVRVSLEVERSAPGVLPQGIRPESCVQRTWYLTVKTPNARLRGDVTLEYIEENSNNREIGAQVRDERALVLWMLSEAGWQRLPTRVNAYANILRTENQDLPATRLLRFVACLPPGR